MRSLFPLHRSKNYYTTIVAAIFVVCLLLIAEALTQQRTSFERAAGVIGGLAGLVVLAGRAGHFLRLQSKLDAQLEDLELNGQSLSGSQAMYAQTMFKLYLTRNSSQLFAIFWLTTLSSLAGFGIVLYGLREAWGAPETLNLAVITDVSAGVLLSFIGGSFMLIYRQLAQQAQQRLVFLERLLSAAFAEKIIERVSPNDQALRCHAVAELTKALIGIEAA